MIPRDKHNSAMPVDLQLDLLVDDELPESQRAPVVRALDAAPGRWRDLAIRFMQRQVERKAIRQMIQQGSIAEGTAVKSLPFPAPPIHHWRVAAAFIVTAGLAAGSALYVDRAISSGAPKTSSPQVSSMMVTVPSGPLTGSLHPR